MFDYFSPRLEEKGFVLLGLSEAGFVYLFSKQDMTGTKGMGKFKMWTWKGDPVSQITMEMIGLPVTPLHIADVNMGLQTGLIDSFYGPPVAVAAFQWYAHATYFLDYKITRSMVCYLMTKEAFQKVSQENRQIIHDVFKAFARETTGITREANADSLRLMEDSGVKVQAPPPLLVEKLKSASDKAVDEMIKRGMFNKEMYQDIKGMLAGHQNRPEGGAE